MKGRSVLFFLIGILFGVFFSSFGIFDWKFSLLLFFVFIILFLIELKNVQKFPDVILFLVLLSAGILVGGFRFEQKQNDFFNSSLNDFLNQKSVFSGFISEELSGNDSTQRVVLKTPSGNILLVLPSKAEVYYGENFEVSGKLKPIENFVDDFDFVNFEKSKGITYEIYYPQVISSSGFSGNIFVKSILDIKYYFEKNIKNLFSEPYASLLSGMVIAGKGSLPKDLSDAFLRAGLMHVVVLSGYNVALVISFLAVIFSGIHIRIRTIAIIFFVCIFVVMAGAGASIIRAAIMAVIALSGKILGRKIRQNRALIFGAALIVVWNPYELVFDPSFALTFLATFGIVNFSEKIFNYFSKIPEKFQIKEIFAQTLAAEIFVMPYILYQMHNFALLAIVSNMLVLPIVPLVTILGIFLAAFGVLGVVLYPIVLVLQFCLAWIIFVVNTIGGLPWAFLKF